MPFPDDIVKVITRSAAWCRQHARMLDRPLTVRAARAHLIKALSHLGSHRSGTGAYATTFVKDQWAIKIMSTRTNQNALAYLTHCRRHHRTNPLLPKVVTIRQVGGLTVVVMERLTHAIVLAKVVSRRLAFWTPRSRFAPVGEVMITPKDHHIHALMGTLNQRIAYLRRTRRVGNLDFHAENVMFRHQRGRLHPVVSDPIMG